ncbi:MAG: hypothetical protein ABI382_03775 [Nakamurella sp.]
MRRTPRRRSRAMSFAGAALLAAAVLTACSSGSAASGSASPDNSGNSTGASNASSSAESSSDDSSSAESSPGESSDEGFDPVVLKGTGRYAIGTQAPLGGYVLHGELDEQPSGCTWSIQDEDGKAAFENQGQYVFLTDIREAITFVTNGCPDWERFQ